MILAAGFGMRMVPINLVAPKAFLEVRGERLIERLIRQLKEAGITDISVVVGFMKDTFEYLIDDYGVKLVYNRDYAVKNNLYSLARVSLHGNTLVLPCDLWCQENPFLSCGNDSWYMVTDRMSRESTVKVMDGVLQRVRDNGNRMVGICYLNAEAAGTVNDKVKKLTSEDDNDDLFWEEVLFEGERMIVPARIVSDKAVTEINTYEQLREFDEYSDTLRSDAIETICEVLHCQPAEIRDITVLKKGMTNRSFLFRAGNDKYIMRIPGEGTDQLISRKNEAEVFRTISGRGLCDDPVYINPENGYKITRFLDGVRTCDPENTDDLQKCMAKLRTFHQMKMTVPHAFDLFEQIEKYESYWQGEPSVYRDYERTKANVLSLKAYIDKQPKDRCLTHIDAVPDNFLFYQEDGEEKLQLTDWEYAGMQDPHVDIAMFCIYSMYGKTQCDQLIDIYFEDKCPEDTRIKIYAYIAVCGLLWSNWCEFKSHLGVEFGEYSLAQYRYAKDYYRYVQEMLKKQGGSHDA